MRVAAARLDAALDGADAVIDVTTVTTTSRKAFS